MAGRTFLMDGQLISNEEQYSSDDGEGQGVGEDDGEEEEEMEYMHHDSGQQYHEDEKEDEQYESDTLAEENAPAMSSGFYSDVDNFLSRPPPGVVLKGSTKGGKKKKKNGAGEAQAKSSSSFPVINDLPKMNNIQSKVSSHRTSKNGKGKAGTNKVLDERLLQQAFEYTNKLQQEAMAEEVYEASMNMQSQKSSSAPQLQYQQQQQQQQQDYGYGQEKGNRKPRSADMQHTGTSSNSNSNSSNRPQKTGASGQGKKKPANSVVRRLRSKTQTTVNQGGKPPRSKAKSGNFDTSTDGECATSTRNVTDFQALVSNFEQGTHLQQLRAELEQSQASMADSRRAMQDISKEMSGKLRI